MRKTGTIDTSHDLHEVRRSVIVSPLPQVPGGPALSVPCDPPSASTASLDHGSRLRLEDKIRHIVDGWSDEEKATAHWYLLVATIAQIRSVTASRATP